MINRVDLGILFIILLFMLGGYYRGLVKSVLSVVQYFVIIFLSISLSPMVSEILTKNFGLDIIIVDWVKNNGGLFGDTIGIISEEILQNIAVRIINVLAVILLFIVLRVVCALIIMILNKVADLPILSVANKFGGLVLGTFNGILIVYLLILLINWLPFESLNMLRNEIALSLLGAAINFFVPEVATEVIGMVKISV